MKIRLSHDFSHYVTFVIYLRLAHYSLYTIRLSFPLIIINGWYELAQ